jgi:aspartate/methionine/tyrosine aminotransferase
MAYAMRRNIVHPGASELNYEIRGITELANEISRLSGHPICWENIGDPVQKGERLPEWIKAIVADTIQDDRAFAYCQTRGVPATREFLAERVNARRKVRITADDILFFNGLGDAINKVYTMLAPQARVIGPSPSYPTHSSAEAAHAGSTAIVYRLNPRNGWMPDMDELRNRVKYNESIAGLMIINPDNPTGAVFPPSVVREMVAIAREYRLFIVADEIYQNLVYDDGSYLPLCDLIEDVPAISLKGISKELPWPGSRCGWMEVYNSDKQPMFRRYVRSLLDAKMLEVCSTTLPQMIIPRVYSDPRYEQWGRERRAFFASRARRATEILGASSNIIVNEPRGAFYLSAVFADELSDRMNLKIEDRRIEEFLKQRCPQGMLPDRKFVYELLGAEQICVVPLAGFMSDLRGFRVTLLERDDATFERVFRKIASAVDEFVESVN